VETLLVARDGGVVTITLNRPERKNALTKAMVHELCRLLQDVEGSDADRVLVFGGSGGDFCSGADLADPDAPGTGDPAGALAWVRRLGDMAVALHRLSKPAIAKVDGVAVGAGLGLALGCDLVVASDRARLSLIFSQRALSLDNATSWLLPRLVGMARAKEIAFFGDMVDAERAVAWGLVNRVVPPAELDPFVEDWARRLASGPALALSTTKALLAGAWSVSLPQAVEHEAQCQAVNLAGADAEEAMAAFLEKRQPRYGAR
jgi:enoyl-CoA hydratase/carnithine racemase